MPLVSVAIPSYNHAPYLFEAVRSVLDQTLDDLELIVVDDGSTDESLLVLDGIQDRRLTVIQQENRGAHAAINRALSEGSGEFVAVLNSDDVYTRDRLAKLVELLRDRPDVSLVGSHIIVVNRSGRPTGLKRGYESLEPWLLEQPDLSFRAGTDLHAALLTENYLATSSNFVFRRDSFDELGGFLPLRYVHDWDFALRLSTLGEVALLPETLLKYRVHDHNTIRQDLGAMAYEICWCLAVHLPRHLDMLAEPDGDLSPHRVEQLLCSIYTYGLEKVLATMLLQDLSKQPGLARTLLDIDNETRAVYMRAISRHLSSVAPSKGGLRTRLGSIVGAIRHALG
jgi:glycosyltransferase involved in cell wall biosynthesis